MFPPRETQQIKNTVRSYSLDISQQNDRFGCVRGCWELQEVDWNKKMAVRVQILSNVQYDISMRYKFELILSGKNDQKKL